MVNNPRPSRDDYLKLEKLAVTRAIPERLKSSSLGTVDHLTSSLLEILRSLQRGDTERGQLRGTLHEVEKELTLIRNRLDLKERTETRESEDTQRELRELRDRFKAFSDEQEEDRQSSLRRVEQLSDQIHNLTSRSPTPDPEVAREMTRLGSLVQILRTSIEERVSQLETSTGDRVQSLEESLATLKHDFEQKSVSVPPSVDSKNSSTQTLRDAVQADIQQFGAQRTRRLIRDQRRLETSSRRPATSGGTMIGHGRQSGDYLRHDSSQYDHVEMKNIHRQHDDARPSTAGAPRGRETASSPEVEEELIVRFGRPDKEASSDPAVKAKLIQLETDVDTLKSQLEAICSNQAQMLSVLKDGVDSSPRKSSGVGSEQRQLVRLISELSQQVTGFRTELGQRMDKSSHYIQELTTDFESKIRGLTHKLDWLESQVVQDRSDEKAEFPANPKVPRLELRKVFTPSPEDSDCCHRHDGYHHSHCHDEDSKSAPRTPRTPKTPKTPRRDRKRSKRRGVTAVPAMSNDGKANCLSCGWIQPPFVFGRMPPTRLARTINHGTAKGTVQSRSRPYTARADSHQHQQHQHQPQPPCTARPETVSTRTTRNRPRTGGASSVISRRSKRGGAGSSSNVDRVSAALKHKSKSNVVRSRDARRAQMGTYLPHHRWTTTI